MSKWNKSTYVSILRKNFERDVRLCEEDFIVIKERYKRALHEFGVPLRDLDTVLFGHEEDDR